MGLLPAFPQIEAIQVDNFHGLRGLFKSNERALI